MELIHGSLLLSILVYTLFGFCVAGGIFGAIGTCYRAGRWLNERRFKDNSKRFIEVLRQDTVVWGGLTIAMWTLVICLDIYVI